MRPRASASAARLFMYIATTVLLVDRRACAAPRRSVGGRKSTVSVVSSASAREAAPVGVRPAERRG